jgi:twitching motility protein PilI
VSDASTEHHPAEARSGRLREFQDQLAERLRKAELAPGSARLGLQVGERRLLVNLTQAGQVVPIPRSMARVPLVRPWLIGLVNLRGTLVAVSDLPEWLGEGPTPRTKESRLLVFGASLRLNAAILVTRMLGLHDTNSWEPAPRVDERPACLGRGLIDPHGDRWEELDLALLAADPAFKSAAR